MSDNLNEDLQKFEELEKLLSEEAEVKSDEGEVEETVESSEEAAEEVVEEATEEVVEEATDEAVEEVAEEAEEAEEEVEEAEESAEEVDMVEKVSEALEAEGNEDVEDESVEDEPAEEAADADEAAEEDEADNAETSEESSDAETEGDSEEEAEATSSDDDEGEDAEAESEDSEEKTADNEEIEAKAATIMARMAQEENQTDMPVLWFKQEDLDAAEEDGEIITVSSYEELDEDAKGAYEPVDVFEEVTGKGWGKRYRRRSPLERDVERKESEEKADEVAEEVADTAKDMFETAEEAVERATELGCEGSHEHESGMFMPCATMEAYQEIVGGEKSEEFLCGQQRKSVQQPCDICRGGCAPEDGLPGLGDIEMIVKSAYEGSEIIGSGYSNVDDMFVVDLKRADGSAIEVFLSGDGQELGWLRIDDDAIHEKALEGLVIVSQADAEAIAEKAMTDLEVEGKIMGVMVDVFADEDVYVVEVEADEKSYDFFISVEGKVVGYDEYEVEAELSEDEEIKALEAELEIKRMYSREQRQSMAESGEALPDGSFPIADEADLSNAIQAFGRAEDKETAKAHIIKRAGELGLEDLLPEGWGAEDAETDEEVEVEEGAEKAALDSEILSALEEFQSMKLEEGLS